MSKNNLSDVFEDLTSLPSLPQAVSEALALLQDEESSLRAIGDVLERDAALSMKILRLANSAYFGVRQEVTSVEHAAALLGRRVIRNVVLSASVFSDFSATSEQFVMFCIASGTAAESLAAQSSAKGVTRAEAFTYGILNHVGELILLEYLPSEREQARQMSMSQGIPLIEAERAVIGASQAEAGARLCRHWRLPERFAKAIECYPQPETCENDEARAWAAVLNVATCICLEEGFGQDLHDYVRLEDRTLSLAGVSSDAVPQVRADLQEAAGAIRDLAVACQ